MMALSVGETLALAAICFVAGVVRGFSGFALSAMIMASAVLILPPVYLIPICSLLEAMASVLMIKGGSRDGDWPMVWRLTAGVVVGTPAGLYLTTTLPVDQSRMLALFVVLALAALQLGRIRVPALGTPVGTYIAGTVSGIASGLASVGGMVIALFVLSQNAPAARMRATLVLYLAVTILVGWFWLIWFDVLTIQSLIRAVFLALPVTLGVLLGARGFIPKYEHLYRPFCLCLLVGLAALGLVRMAL